MNKADNDLYLHFNWSNKLESTALMQPFVILINMLSEINLC